MLPSSLFMQVCSMIEIEVEMDADVSAAEAGGATVGYDSVDTTCLCVQHMVMESLFLPTLWSLSLVFKCFFPGQYS